MDNAPFHKPKDDINELIKRSIRLPPYCPELKSIEHLWAIFKSKVKRSQFGDAEDLNTRISEGSQDIPVNILQNIIDTLLATFKKFKQR